MRSSDTTACSRAAVAGSMAGLSLDPASAIAVSSSPSSSEADPGSSPVDVGSFAAASLAPIGVDAAATSTESGDVRAGVEPGAGSCDSCSV